MRLNPLSLALLALITPSVCAADAGADASVAAECPDSTVTCLDHVQVTATKRPESTLDVPAATTIVGAAALRGAAPQTVMDALHGEVGTFVQQTTPGQGVVIVRGLKGSEVLHLVDGFRLNNSIFRNAPNQYIALVDSQNVDTIEVVRGPSSTLYGGDAMGGVVQMLTREPRFKGATWQFGGRLRAIYGSADESMLGRAEFAAGHDGVAISGGMTYQDVNDLRVGGGDRLHPSGFTSRAGDFKLRMDAAEGHELTANVQLSRQPRTPRFDALVPGFQQSQPDNAVFYFEPQERRFAQLRWRVTRPTTLFDEAQFNIGRQEIVDDRRTRAFESSNEDRERNSDTLTGVFGQFGKALGAHYLSYGFEAYDDEVASSRTRTHLPTGAITPRTPRFPDGSSMKSQALYVADDWLIGERVDLNFGARYSRFDIEIPATVRLKPDDLTGNIGLAVELVEDVRFVGNLGRGFRAPNIFDLGLFGERPGGRFSIANSQLGPETVTTFDAGFKFGGAQFSGELIAFRSRYRDKIDSVPTGDGMTADGVACVPGSAGCLEVVQNRNVDAVNLWGVEAGARYHFAQPQLQVYATATWTRGEIVGDGEDEPADRIPPLFGKAGLLWQANEAVSLEGYTLYAARQDRFSAGDRSDPRINPNGTAGWATLNARIGWRVSEHLDLALRAENLADKRYREHGTGLDEPGRNFLLTADFRF